MDTSNINNNDLVLPVLAGTVIFASLIIFIIYFILLYNKAQQRFNGERQRFKETLLQTEIEIREQTLKHVSRELHDNLGHIASLVKINLNMISREVSIPDRTKLDESLELLKQLIADIKSLSVSLNSENITRQGFRQVLENTISRINRTGSVHVKYIEHGSLPQLSDGIEIILYRICQEMFNNTLQHAEATYISLTSICADHYLALEYTDNGKGFDVERKVSGSEKSGSGLSNIISRCNIIGAEITINSRPGDGTSIRISLPLPTPA